MFRWQPTGIAEAREYLFAQINTNGDKILSVDEIASSTVKVFGYSMGGSATLAFVQSISEPGINSDGYTLESGIPIAALVTFDPVIPPTFFEECK